MGYERDEASGKFRWVDNTGAPGEEPIDFLGEAPPSPTAPAFAWQPWALAVLVVAAVVWWGISAVRNQGESIVRIRNHAASFDGQQVRLQGRVGDVFEMGGSTAFYLHQGRDTIVVFARDLHPQTNQNLTVTGSISIGYLDGVARPALFARSAR